MLVFFLLLLLPSKVKEAATEQMSKLWHTTNIYMHPKIHEYAERITETLPGDLKVNKNKNSELKEKKSRKQNDTT